MNQPESPVHVRLLIFSGRPDPEWPLAPETVAALRARLATPPGAELAEAPSAPPPLGYRGFLVRTRERFPGLPEEFVVGRGTIRDTGARPRHWRDSAGIEALLIEEAHRNQYGDVLASLGVGRPQGGGPPPA